MWGKSLCVLMRGAGDTLGGTASTSSMVGLNRPRGLSDGFQTAPSFFCPAGFSSSLENYISLLLQWGGEKAKGLPEQVLTVLFGYSSPQSKSACFYPLPLRGVFGCCRNNLKPYFNPLPTEGEKLAASPLGQSYHRLYLYYSAFVLVIQELFIWFR